MSLYKAKLIENKPIKEDEINKHRFIIRHAIIINPNPEDIVKLLKKNGCTGIYEKRDDISGSFQTKNVTSQLLDELNVKLLKYTMKVFPYKKRKKKNKPKGQIVKKLKK
jgi:hypothetical protein